MIASLQRRPFLRPLALWVLGVLIQSYLFMADSLWWLLPVLLLGLLLSSWVSRRKPSGMAHYSTRWTWGVFFSLLLVFFAMQRTAADQRKPVDTTHSIVSMQSVVTVRQQALARLDGLPLPIAEQAVLKALLLGDRSALNRHARQKFAATGLAHLLAVSGFHVGVVCAFIALLFRFLGRSYRSLVLQLILTAGLMWFYIAITGFGVSALRAGWMISLYLLARLLRREADLYNVLAASALGLLIYRPAYLFDVGFQLSYLALFSIRFMQPLWDRFFVMRNPLLSYPVGILLVSIAAQVGTAGLLFYYFGSVSLIGLLTALPATWLTIVLIPVGWIWLICPAHFPGVALLQTLLVDGVLLFTNLVDRFQNN